MNAKQMETRFWQSAAKQRAQPTTNYLRRGYVPPGGRIADFTICKHEGLYHLFHIERRPGGCCAWPGHEIYFGHSTTLGFSTWRCYDPVMLIRPGTWEGAHVYAPFVFTHEGVHYMFYTGLNDRDSQQIGVATSNDLFHWERHEGNPIVSPAGHSWAFWSPDEACSCRDPHVVQLDGLFHMYYTAVTHDGHGCVACATSNDLFSWEDRGPVITIAEEVHSLGTGSNHLESAAIHRLDDDYLLIYNHMGAVRVNRSRSPYDFGNKAGRPLWTGMNGLEVIERRDPNWLVAAFDAASERLYIGLIDWSEPNPTVRRAQEPSELRDFLL